jgi:hypothetical protein
MCQENIGHHLIGSIEAIKANVNFLPKTHNITEVLED